MRIVFFGSPDFASSILNRLLQWKGAEVVGVVTQPDRPAGRGKILRPTPVKKIALEKNIPIFQPINLKEEGITSSLKSLSPDIFIVVAYGLILPESIIYLPPLGTINVHASLLPKYRGAAPIQWAILKGEPVTGITIMQMEKGLDTGPILLQRALAIGIDDTAQSLHEELAQMGGELLVQSLIRIEQGTIIPIPQDNNLASYAPKLKKGIGKINWTDKALDIHNKIRALYPWPMAYFRFDTPKGEINVQVFPGKIGEKRPGDIPPGKILGVHEDMLQIACEDRIYKIPRLKPQSSKTLSAQEFACGYL